MCAKCGRWNLTPLEERWEAIEDCERLFRATILRSSTDQIGLARIKEGTDLIRIGQPLRPEFAAWRYGKHLEHRRRMMYAAIGISAVATVGIFAFAGSSFSLGVPGFTAIHRLLTRKHDIGLARKRIRDVARSNLRQDIRDDQKVYVRVIPISSSAIERKPRSPGTPSRAAPSSPESRTASTPDSSRHSQHPAEILSPARHSS